MNTKIFIPNLLTFSRFFLSITILPILLYVYLPSDSWYVTGALAVFFALLSATDFLDGYYARRWKVSSPFGAVADHAADKIMVASTMICLVALHKMYFLWAILFIAREFFVMALREYGLKEGIAVKVNFSGKLKAFLQYVYLFFVILLPTSILITHSLFIQLLLYAALGASLCSAGIYTYSFYQKYVQRS